MASWAALLLGACGAPASSAEAPRPVPAGRGLAALDLGEAALLPSSAVAAPPASPVPAFDAAYVADLPSGGSYSIGTTSRGYLMGGEALPTDEPALVPRPVSLARDATWGTRSFVQALVRAARHVADRWPGSRLFAGDLALRGGGNFSPHASHASGRDADLSFYVRDAAGPADGPEMRWVDAAGAVSGTALTFDAARNWALVEALLRDPEVQVQWIFVAAHLEPLLLAAGRDAGADATTLARAAAVLQQPGDSSPHADHFHVRVYCGEAERLEGCLDAAPFYAWVDRHDAAVARWVDGLAPFLSMAPREEFRFAVERLVRANATVVVPRLVALRDAGAFTDPASVALVDDAIAFLGGRRTPAAWARWRADDAGD